jgi:hypothetical protein
MLRILKPLPRNRSDPNCGTGRRRVRSARIWMRKMLAGLRHASSKKMDASSGTTAGRLLGHAQIKG